jgi:hypothetical protein
MKHLSAADLLLEKFLDYQRESGERKSAKEFALYVGIHESMLNELMSGKRVMGRRVATRLADMFNDPRFYDAVDMPRKDPRLDTIIKAWGALPEKLQNRFSEEAAKYLTSEEDDE